MSECGPKVKSAVFDCQQWGVNCGPKKSKSLTVPAATAIECGQLVAYDPATMTVVTGALAAGASAYAISTQTFDGTAAADDATDFYTTYQDINIDVLNYAPLTEAQVKQALVEAGGHIVAVRPSHGGVA